MAVALLAPLALAGAPSARAAGAPRARAACAEEASVDAKKAQIAASLRAHGDAEMDAGAFADAIASYRASYDLSRNPALLYDIGSAYERLGDYPRSLAYLEQFSRVASPDLLDRVPRLDQLIGAVRAKLARVVVRCNVPGARVMIRGTWKGTTPLAADIVTMPGAARVEVVADGYRPFLRDVVLTAGTATRVDAVLLGRELLVPSTGARAGDAREEGQGGAITTKWWFWTSLGVVATATATVVVVALTRDHHAPSGDITPGQVSTPLVTW
jgi:tetratricopeptide (TPR) repeat protein